MSEVLFPQDKVPELPAGDTSPQTQPTNPSGVVPDAPPSASAGAGGGPERRRSRGDGTPPAPADAAPQVVLDGTLVPGSVYEFADGLEIVSSHVTIQGLAIINFPRFGIFVDGGTGDLIRGNYIGLDLAGHAGPNMGGGVMIPNPLQGITIGGTTVADRNVISANGVANLRLDGGAAGNASQIVQGNFIGTELSGTGPVAGAPSGVSGIEMVSSGDNTIGGLGRF